MKKIFALGMAAMLLLTAAGCAPKEENPTPPPEEPPVVEQTIDVISREEGSGTRGAFIELFGIEQKDASGNKVDMTIDTAEINSSTSVVITTVAGDPNAIGYISLGSLNDTVKAVAIGGVAPSVAGVKDGSYTVARPFNIVTKGEATGLTKDFIDYIMSAEGQKVIEDNGYISEGNTGAYAGSKPAGSITVAGSSSVTPVMEKLKEAYMALNTGASIDIQMSDSTTGMTSAIDGICDIGMASREVKDSELEKGLSPTTIAMDGIAVIVNKGNEVSDLTKEDVLGIYTGTITDWSELK
ncbi:MAG TPA: substrate-binding domain-containing protein [Terriglobales bacterium]|nr:substrate-binding domain-containing protein [Terriglobales bacterium]